MSRPRSIVDIVLLLALLCAPWWVTAIGALAATFYFEDYLEMLVFGFLYDVLYGVPQEHLFWMPTLFTISAVFAYGILLLLKKYTRIHV